MDWQNVSDWEANWWGNCANTYWEETKQQVYAKKMGLQATSENGKYPVYDFKNKSVLDIGGGPTSLLLKSINLEHGTVVDPCKYPNWVAMRYEVANIKYHVEKAENIGTTLLLPLYDEVLIYNVLQHVVDPETIIANARKIGRIIRLFEWVNTEISDGHPHTLTENKLNDWLGGEGKVEAINESGCHGMCYYGVFVGNNYAKI